MGESNNIMEQLDRLIKPHKLQLYIICPKKGRPRKHVDVCRKCKQKNKCAAYQDYIQPKLF